MATIARAEVVALGSRPALSWAASTTLPAVPLVIAVESASSTPPTTVVVASVGGKAEGLLRTCDQSGAQLLTSR